MKVYSVTFYGNKWGYSHEGEMYRELETHIITCSSKLKAQELIQKFCPAARKFKIKMIGYA